MNNIILLEQKNITIIINFYRDIFAECYRVEVAKNIMFLTYFQLPA